MRSIAVLVSGFYSTSGVTNGHKNSSLPSFSHCVNSEFVCVFPSRHCKKYSGEIKYEEH